MSALCTRTQPLNHPGANAGELLPEDLMLARLVRQSLRDLARHSSAYAAVFATKSGARLAHHVTGGHVAQLSESGRSALKDVYSLTQAALTVEPGVDTNTLIDRITGRRNPRTDSTPAAG